MLRRLNETFQLSLLPFPNCTPSFNSSSSSPSCCFHDAFPPLSSASWPFCAFSWCSLCPWSHPVSAHIWILGYDSFFLVIPPILLLFSFLLFPFFLLLNFPLIPFLYQVKHQKLKGQWGGDEHRGHTQLSVFQYLCLCFSSLTNLPFTVFSSLLSFHFSQYSHPSIVSHSELVQLWRKGKRK